MTATNHGLFGAVIAVTLSTNPIVAIMIAPLSHFLLDAIPHFGVPENALRSRKFFVILALDAFVAVVSTIILAVAWSQIWFLVIVCAFLAASPDLMWIYYEYMHPELKHKHLIPKFHSWIQWSQTNKGLVIELAWYAILMSILIIKSR